MKEGVMTNRTDMEQLTEELHAARIAGELDRLSRLFAEDARFRIAGTSDGKPIAITTAGLAGIRPWLSMLVKTFRLTGYELHSRVIDDRRAALHWSADIHSKITGVSVPTELVDLVEVRERRIVSYIEFFVPR
jgi:ketosteroid isomerase-like protein